MVKLYDEGIYLVNGTEIVSESEAAKVQALTGKAANKEEAKKGTMACSILSAHNTSGDMEHLKLKFDAMASHDITFVGIVQTAKASGMEKFPLPYVLTNCHNSLCAVGGTINEDDHMFGLSAAKKYGGIYVPPHIAVIHQYMREMHAGCGRMILGSDSHTRYGALGTMAIGEGGGELVKQLLCDTYDVAYPGVVAIYLTGKPGPGIGPQDVALSIIGAVFKKGYVKNKVMEFVGPGVASMTTDYRNGVDVMTTETTCLTSIWRTDEDTKAFLTAHGRGDAYKELNPADVAYYDGCVYVDLSTIKPMIALPFHPSNTYEIDELNANLGDILRSVEKEAEKVSGGRATFTLTDKIENGRLRVQQGIIAGCAGGNFIKGKELRRWRILTGCISFFPACIYRPGKKGPDRRSDGSRRYHQNRILRTMLRRRRYTLQQWFKYPSYNQKLPEPGRQQARKRPDVSSSINGCTFYRSNCSKRRYPYTSYRLRLLGRCS